MLLAKTRLSTLNYTLIKTNLLPSNSTTNHLDSGNFLSLPTVEAPSLTLGYHVIRDLIEREAAAQ